MRHDHHAQALREFDNVRGAIGGQGMLALFDAPWTPIIIAVVYLFHPLLGVIAESPDVLTAWQRVARRIPAQPGMLAVRQDLAPREDAAAGDVTVHLVASPAHEQHLVLQQLPETSEPP